MLLSIEQDVWSEIVAQSAPNLVCKYACKKFKLAVQGNCKTAPAEANLSTEMQSSIPTDTWVPGQCMLVASEPAFLVMSGNVWFDKLILAVASDVSAPANPNVTLLEVRQTFQGGTGSNMFLTNMLFKGDGASRAIAMSPQHVGSTTGTPVTKFHSLLARGVCTPVILCIGSLVFQLGIVRLLVIQFDALSSVASNVLLLFPNPINCIP